MINAINTDKINFALYKQRSYIIKKIKYLDLSFIYYNSNNSYLFDFGLKIFMYKSKSKQLGINYIKEDNEFNQKIKVIIINAINIENLNKI